jgi:hypothetical protein
MILCDIIGLSDFKS